MGRVFLVSDDLSGAADAAAAFAGANLHTIVALADAGIADHAEVVAIDANTRALDLNSAVAETSRIFLTHARNGDLIFKKIDSMLRGHLAAEIGATLSACRQRGITHRGIVIVAPAFPAQGRTTLDGFQLVSGSSAAPGDSPAESMGHIPSLIRKAALMCASIELATVRSGVDALRSAIREIADGHDVLVCDAETDQDLAAIAEAGRSLGQGVIWAGSAGLAHQLAATVRSGPSPGSMMLENLTAGPTLFVVGSPSPTAIRQTERLRGSGRVAHQTIAPALMSSDLVSSEQSKRMRTLRDSLAQGIDALMTLDCNSTAVNEEPLLCETLARHAASIIDLAGAIVACGGATARAMLLALGEVKMQVICEVESGVVLSVVSHRGQSLPVITKAGAFGEEDTLVRCADFLRRLDRDRPAKPTLIKEL